MNNKRKIARYPEALSVGDLVSIQRKSYERFLQADVEPKKRRNEGLESLFRETFPIESYDKSVRLEYLYYTLGKPMHSEYECHKLSLTYGRPLRARLRMVIEGGETKEEDVYIGDVPVMIGGGEFIINGTERVIVSQLHRSPGVDFGEEEVPGERQLFNCRVLPERGSWLEIYTTRKDTIELRIDKSQRFPATLFLRAMLNPDDPMNGKPPFDTDEEVVRAFYPTEVVELSSKNLRKVVGKWLAHDLLVGSGDKEDNKKEPAGVSSKEGGKERVKIGSLGEEITPEMVQKAIEAGVKKIEIIEEMKDRLILNTM
ncbi:MAG: DNA-directed RNA polymerase subunit beta, partial [Planctomycetota bacterium]|nr:DNA-directed RNA polymerase subunit beta [Planctomycetota bacterium]